MLRGRHRVPVFLNRLGGCFLQLRSSATTDHGAGTEAKRPADTFRRASRGKFFQTVPQLRNPFIEDTLVQSYLKRTMPEEVGVANVYNVTPPQPNPNLHAHTVTHIIKTAVELHPITPPSLDVTDMLCKEGRNKTNLITNKLNAKCRDCRDTGKQGLDC